MQYVSRMAARKKVKSMQGRLLLDGGRLHGSWFHRSVVLICQHDAEGAFGLVLNRPAGARVGDALPGDIPEPLADLALRVGGPVQPGALSYLRCEPGLDSGSVMPGVDLGHALDELLELGSAPPQGRRFLVFAGYAGWSPGQLDTELARDAWVSEPARMGWLLDPEPETLWKRILRARGGLYRLLADAPDLLSSN